MGSSFFGEDTKVSVKFIITLVVLLTPLAAFGLHVIRSLDAITLQLVLIHEGQSKQDQRINGDVRSERMESWVREAQAKYPDLPDFER